MQGVDSIIGRQEGKEMHSGKKLYLLMSCLLLSSAFLGGVIFTGIVSIQRSLHIEAPDFVDFEESDDEMVGNVTKESHFNDSHAFSTILSGQEHVESCLMNPDNCPNFKPHQLESDWEVRYLKKNRGGCYFEFKVVSTECFKVCEDLFFNAAHHPGQAFRVTQACTIGCNYARISLAKQLERPAAKPSCMKNCRQTIWRYSDRGPARCGFKTGLYLPKMHLEEDTDFVEYDKACEFGCIIGNERPCPVCDEKAANLKFTTVQA